MKKKTADLKTYMQVWYQEHKNEVKARSDTRYREKKEDIKKKQDIRKPEKQAYMLVYSKAYYKDNRDKILARTKEWANNNPEKRKAAARRYELGQIGWTLEMYEVKFSEQNGLCAICKQPVEGVLDADHEHVEPPKPRGLLCHLCNIGIGAFKDDPKRLLEALNYLRKYNSDAT